MADLHPRRPNSSGASAEDIRFRILHALGADPTLSQRRLARATGVSLGAANALLNTLIERGLVEIGNSETAPARFRIAYVLTAKGRSEKAGLSSAYVARRQAEIVRLQDEIAELTPAIGAAR